MCTLLDCDPGQVLLVGDDYHADVFGGKFAGLRVAWVNRKKAMPDSLEATPDLELHSLTEFQHMPPVIE